MEEKQPATAQPSKEYAGFWRRYLAYSIDGIIIGIISSVLGFSSYYSIFMSAIASASTAASGAPVTPTVNPLVSFLGLFIGIAYFLFFWVRENGQTLGHRLMALRVEREDGKPIDIGTGILRYIGYIISSIIFFLGFLWIAWDPKKQGWHDKIARTVVVKTGAKSHTAIAIIIVFGIPLIVFGLLMVIIIAGVLVANPGAQMATTYPKAIFAATNAYRTAHQLPVITEDQTICAYVDKRIAELEAQKTYSASTGYAFDDHQGFIEDLANPQLHDAYFGNFGSPTEYYSHTQSPAVAAATVNSWMNLQDSELKLPSYTYGCVRGDNVYTVFIAATAPQAAPTATQYNTTQQNTTNTYPTLPPYATPTMSAAAQQQMQQFQQDYNNAKASIDQAQNQH